MSHPYTLSENTAQVQDSSIPYNGWELSGEFSPKETPLFDGKIIARMPDLGSDSICQSTEDTNSRSFWGKLGSPFLSIHAQPAPGKHFFHRFTATGCVILLCGIGILLLERNEPTTETTRDVAEIETESPILPTQDASKITYFDSALVAAVEPESNKNIIPAAPTAPVMSVAAVPPPNIPPKPPTESVWNRPASDSYSPWNIAAREPENSLAEVETMKTPPPPISPPETVAMIPMIDMSMPVSPHEQQWVAQSNPQVRPSVDPFMQANTNAQRPAAPPHVQYLPANAVQGVHAQYSQHNQNVPGNAPSNMPIPTGASTLPGGNFSQQQHPNGMALSVPPHSEYYNAPPTHRRVY